MRPSEAIGCRILLSTLVQIIVCCLTTSCRYLWYLNLGWVTISEVLWYSYQAIVYSSYKSQIVSEIYTFEITAASARVQWFDTFYLISKMQNFLFDKNIWLILYVACVVCFHVLCICVFRFLQSLCMWQSKQFVYLMTLNGSFWPESVPFSS